VDGLLTLLEQSEFRAWASLPILMFAAQAKAAKFVPRRFSDLRSVHLGQNSPAHILFALSAPSVLPGDEYEGENCQREIYFSVGIAQIPERYELGARYA
jgi:hypothetical protein